MSDTYRPDGTRRKYYAGNGSHERSYHHENDSSFAHRGSYNDGHSYDTSGENYTTARSARPHGWQTPTGMARPQDRARSHGSASWIGSVSHRRVQELNGHTSGTMGPPRPSRASYSGSTSLYSQTTYSQVPSYPTNRTSRHPMYSSSRSHTNVSSLSRDGSSTTLGFELPKTANVQPTQMGSDGIAATLRGLGRDFAKLNKELIGNTSISAHGHHLSSEFQIGKKYAMFDVGDIVWGPWVVSCIDPDALSEEDKYRGFAWADSVGPITGKYKPIIVSAIYKTHLVGFPVHTSDGKGLRGKDAVTKSLCLHLVDCYVDGAELHGQHYLRCSALKMKDGAYVNMAQPFVLNLQCPLKHGGKLTIKSLERFRMFMAAYLNQGHNINKGAKTARPILTNPPLTDIASLPTKPDPSQPPPQFDLEDNTMQVSQLPRTSHPPAARMQTRGMKRGSSFHSVGSNAMDSDSGEEKDRKQREAKRRRRDAADPLSDRRSN